MEIALSIIYLIGGFMLLIYGADKFVDGAVALAKKMGIPSLIVGLTIVALGTSMPELAISVSSAIAGSASMSVSNVIGSNIFNVLGVLGVCAIAAPLSIKPIILKWDFPVCIASTVLMVGCICGFSGILGFMPYAYIALYVLYVIITIIIMRGNEKKSSVKVTESKNEANVEEVPFVWYKCAFNILGGLCAIVTGGELVVQNATKIGAAFGMSETLIGLTICAVGTSLPELVTSFIATRKGQLEIAMGNVVGSSMLNILIILGVSGAISPIVLADDVLTMTIIDATVALGTIVLTYILSLTGKKINRTEGIIMLVTYIGYVAYTVIR